MAGDLFDLKLSVLLKEWDYTQTHIARLDTILFQIRAWAVTAVGLLATAASSQRFPALMLVGVVLVVVFFLIDALYKYFQRKYIQREQEIERYLANDLSADFARREIEFDTPNMGLRFGRGSGSAFHRMTSVVESAMLRNVIVVYLAMLVVSLATYLILVMVTGELVIAPPAPKS